jgi:hypothetical protein
MLLNWDILWKSKELILCSQFLSATTQNFCLYAHSILRSWNRINTNCTHVSAHAYIHKLSLYPIMKCWKGDQKGCMNEVLSCVYMKSSIRINSGLLWTLQWTSGFEKTGRSFWESQQLLASQELFSSRSQLLYWKLMLLFFVKLITHSLTHGAELFLRSRQLWSYSRNFQCFMEPEGSLPRSQEPFTGSYPQPDRSSPYHLSLPL